MIPKLKSVVVIVMTSHRLSLKTERKKNTMGKHDKNLSEINKSKEKLLNPTKLQLGIVNSGGVHSTQVRIH